MLSGPFFTQLTEFPRFSGLLDETTHPLGAHLGSVQNLSHFGLCDGGSMGLKFHFV